MDFPRRTRICLDCRSALCDGEECDGAAVDHGKRHRAVTLDAAGRAALVTEVWGPPSIRRQAKAIARAGTGGATAGGIGSCFDPGCAGCDAPADGEGLVIVLAIVAAALVAILLYWAIRALVRYARVRMNTLEPHPPLRPTPDLRRAQGRAGTIVAAPDRGRSPLELAPCVGFGVELVRKWTLRSAPMLIDGATVGFDVKLDSGETVRVPAGRLRVDGPRRTLARDEASQVEEYVRTVDPGHGTTDEWPPIPFDEAQEIVVGIGDRVEIIGELAPTADPSAAGSYRESAWVLAPAGVPMVRVVERVDAQAR
jgi:hypothetical protein